MRSKKSGVRIGESILNRDQTFPLNIFEQPDTVILHENETLAGIHAAH
jgi:hypothetical protein